MSFAKQTLKNVNLKNKKVLVRAMLNAPIKNNKVTDTARLEAAKPTIDYLLDRGASVVLISHHSSKRQSLEPVAKALPKVLDHSVKFIDDCVGSKVDRAIKALKPLDVLVLENLRFHPGEEANGVSFAKELASYCDVFVQDDFTTCHRKHASIVGVPKFAPSVAGLQLVQEVTTISGLLENPKRPMTVVTGGAKVSTKIPTLSFLLSKADNVFVGGAMANTFLLAQGKNVGKSLAEPNQVETAKKIMSTAKKSGKTILLPKDVVVVSDVENPKDIRTISVDEVSDSDVIVDLGPDTINQLDGVLSPGGSVVWNGPIGISETDKLAEGTKQLAKKIIDSKAYSLVGGGDTLAFVNDAGLSDKFSFVSTGGGASLELMSGNGLPGVDALPTKD